MLKNNKKKKFHKKLYVVYFKYICMIYFIINDINFILQHFSAYSQNTEQTHTH